ncbi:hypothetical protein GP644_23660, partial [Parasedimentitalea maritima]
RRSRGGAVRFGEMESLALTASGMPFCLSELRDRSDMVVVEVCVSCNSIVGTCVCAGNIVSRKMALPASTVAFSYAMVCMYGRSLRVSE